MALDRELFDNLILEIKEKHPELKIRIYRKHYFTPGGASGEYMDNNLAVAIGPRNGKVDWEWIIGTLAHEYAHFIREKRHSKSYNKRLYESCGVLYSKSVPMKERQQAAYWTIEDEYHTDCEAYEVVLKRWGLQNEFTDWYYWANMYNYKIKYLLETGILFSDREGKVKAPRYRLTKEELHKPLTRKKKREIDRLINDGEIEVAIRDYHKNVSKKNT